MAEIKSRGTLVLEGRQICCACMITLDEGEEVAFLLYVDEATLRRRRFYAHLGTCEARL